MSAASAEETAAIPDENSGPEILIVPPTIKADVHHADLVERWRPLVASIFPAFAVDPALRVMWCESRGDPNATGAQGERGLLQIMPYWHQRRADALFGLGADLYDPHINLSVAYEISSGGRDWSAWTCQP